MKRSCAVLQKLAYEVLHAPAAATVSGASGKHKIETMVILHGILGNKKNLRTLAKEVQKLRPHVQAVLVDHRGHGDSIALADHHNNDHDNDSNNNQQSHTHTVQDCANDLVETFRSADFVSTVYRDVDPHHAARHSFVPDYLCAHSFGGKVALRYYQHLLHDSNSADPAGKRLKDVWVLDASPFQYPASVLHDASAQSVAQVIAALVKAPRVFPHRNAAQQYLTETARLPLALAQWLSASVLPQSGGGVRLALDLAVAPQLFRDFVATDCDSFLREIAHREKAGNDNDTVVHFLRAEKNTLWESSGDWRRLSGIVEEARRKHDHSTRKHTHRVSLEALEMKNVGHWLHAEQPAQVAQLLHLHSAHPHHNNL